MGVSRLEREPWSLLSLKKEFSKETEGSEASKKHLLEEKYVQKDTHTGRLGEGVAYFRGSLDDLDGGRLLDSLWPIIMLPLALCPYLVWLGVLPSVCTHLLAKADSSMWVSGRLAGHIMSITPFLFDPWGTFLCLCGGGGLLGFNNGKWGPLVF